jgi:hypothetical protein
MIKPIEGSWFEFQHSLDVEGLYWNQALAGFSESQWEEKVKEAAEAGMKHLVLMSVALKNRAFYHTEIFPPASMVCPNPLETVLAAADKYDVNFFISNDFFGDWSNARQMIADPDVHHRRLQCMNELAEQYGHHKSFIGWYWPNEACIERYFSEEFIKYVNDCSREARRLMPAARTLIAPYGTRNVAADDKYVRQLERMDVDIIAYQDEIGVRKTKVPELAAFYESLRKLHNKVPQRALWADVEVFEFEGDVYKSALIPASFERVEEQLRVASAFVDRILIYQFQGMMNKPGSKAYAGHPQSTVLYADYAHWLKLGRRDSTNVLPE